FTGFPFNVLSERKKRTQAGMVHGRKGLCQLSRRVGVLCFCSSDKKKACSRVTAAFVFFTRNPDQNVYAN
ncbi:hypothetical protein, partial [Massilia sp.]|uniref:hypothetical protein n=1 Tax=Massilia sp. TaxID=1882437 RepID=UPI0028AE63FD